MRFMTVLFCLFFVFCIVEALKFLQISRGGGGGIVCVCVCVCVCARARVCGVSSMMAKYCSHADKSNTS